MSVSRRTLLTACKAWTEALHRYWEDEKDESRKNAVNLLHPRKIFAGAKDLEAKLVYLQKLGLIDSPQTPHVTEEGEKALAEPVV